MSSAACVTIGLAISFHYGTAGGATIAGLAVLVFFVVFAVREPTAAVRRITRRPAAHPEFAESAASGS